MPRPISMARWRVQYVARLNSMSNEELLTETLAAASLAGSDQSNGRDQIEANLCELALRIRLVEGGFLKYTEISHLYWK